MISASKELPPSERLREKFRQANATNAPWMELLQMFYDDDFFRNRLQRFSTRAVRRSRLPKHLQKDVSQEALILFAKSLQRNSSLGFDFDKGNFNGFVNMLLSRFCSNGLRSFKNQNARSINEVRCQPSYCEQLQVDDRIDLEEAIEQIPHPYNEVIRAICDGQAIAQIAVALNRSERTIYRWIDKGIEYLQILRDDEFE